MPFRDCYLSWWQRRRSTHARVRCLGEKAMATLKGRRLLRQLLRCSINEAPRSSSPLLSFITRQPGAENLLRSCLTTGRVERLHRPFRRL